MVKATHSRTGRASIAAWIPHSSMAKNPLIHWKPFCHVEIILNHIYIHMEQFHNIYIYNYIYIYYILYIILYILYIIYAYVIKTFPQNASTALAHPRYSIQQGHGRRASRREEAARCSAEAQPPRRTGAEIRPRLSMEYHKVLGEMARWEVWWWFNGILWWFNGI